MVRRLVARKEDEDALSDSSPQIGVLDLQGGVQEHLDHLQRIGIIGARVKNAADIVGLAGLILPGGETTCLARLLRIFNIEEVIVREYQRGLKLWGTCAGAILLAQKNLGKSSYLGLIDIDIKRNAFGSQMDSFMRTAFVPRVAQDPIPLVFIRAPKIIRVGSGVDILLRLDDYIAAAENKNVLVTVFHPELTPSPAFHRYFAAKCGLSVADRSKTAETDWPWTRTSWMRFAHIGGA
jgi:5'-phosphate synthase pdxT subunit